MKSGLNFLAIICFLIASVYFFGSEAPDDSCDDNWTPECEKQDEEFEEAMGPCCISFILMCVFAVWGKKVQDTEALETQAELEKELQESRAAEEVEAREKAASEKEEREELLQKKKNLEEKRRGDEKRAEKLRLQKEIEELEDSLDN